jgi:hypothetical protein
MANQCVRYYGWFSVLTGSKSSAIAASQLFYWYEKVQRKFYKTDKQLTEETWLNQKEIQRAKIRFKKLDFIHISVEDSPPKTYYSFDIKRLNEHLKLIGLDPSKCHNLTGKTEEGHVQNVHIEKDKMYKSIWTKCPFLPYTKEYKQQNVGEANNGFGVNGLSRFDIKRAKQLYEALANKRKIMRQPNMGQWVREFHELRKDGYSRETISRVLFWYTNHIGERYIPAAYAAKTFRQKFQNIMDAMERTGESAIKIEITPATIKLAEIKKIPKNLLFAVQKSMNLIQFFLEKARKLENNTAKILLERFESPNHLVGTWFEAETNPIQKNDLEVYGRKLAKKVCGNPARWDSTFGEVMQCL